MIVDINKIIVKDRIRKDFGDIQELADDIQRYGLINPPVVNKEYELLAGERRLRACKSLGWKQIEVRMMDTRDAEHELNVEISENENRKEFSKSERVDYMKRLLRIEQAKAKERQGERNDLKNIPQISAESKSESREVVASQFGISRDTMKKEMSIVDNKDLLDPSDFADWDEGKLSTNKAFQKIKEQMKDLKEERDYLQFQLEEEKNKEPKVVTKTVKVTPDDYAFLKKRQSEYVKDMDKLAEQSKKKQTELEAQIKQLEKEKQTILNGADDPVRKYNEKLKTDCIFFCQSVASFLEKNGGYIYLGKEFERLPDTERKSYLSAISLVREWAETMLNATVEDIVQ